MRRKDKEIRDIKEIESIINKSNVCRIALSENESPYIIPVCFGYKDNCLYLNRYTPQLCCGWDKAFQLQPHRSTES